MNYTISIFGRNGDLFWGYPDSSFESHISRYHNISRDGELLVVHQEHDLMTYSYIRPVQNGFFGFVFAFNKIATDQIRTLFRICESQIEKLIIDGEIIQFNDSGLIIFNEQLTPIKDDVAMRIIENLRHLINEGSHSFYQIDYTSYNLPDNDKTIVNVNSLPEKAAALIKRNRTVYFIKDGNANSLLVNSYALKLAGLTEEIKNYKKLVVELEKRSEFDPTIWKALSILQFFIIITGIVYLIFMN